MVTYDLTVERQSIYGADRFTIAAHADKTVEFRFFFDRNWRIFDSKAAVFRNQKGEYYIIEIRNSRVTVPWEVLKETGKAEMSLLGFERDTVITSQKVDIFVNESLLPEEYEQLNPSETLFDRFRKECTAEAYLEYENEIKRLTGEYESKLVHMSTLINEANERTEAVTHEKDREILNLKRDHTKTVALLQNEIADNKNMLNRAEEKAAKWNLIDRAVSLKNDSSAPIWGKSADKFSLPMMNTEKIKAFYPAYFDNKLVEVGLNLKSADSFAGSFKDKRLLEKITLVNTEQIKSFEGAFENCMNLKLVQIDSVDNCLNFARMFINCSSLEKVSAKGVYKGTAFSNIFNGCIALKEICGEFDFSSSGDKSSAFARCSALEKITFKNNTINNSVVFKDSPVLSKESVMSIVNGLDDSVSATLFLSNYCFNNNFPTEAEREELISFVSDTKGWILSLV